VAIALGAVLSMLKTLARLSLACFVVSCAVDPGSGNHSGGTNTSAGGNVGGKGGSTSGANGGSAGTGVAGSGQGGTSASGAGGSGTIFNMPTPSTATTRFPFPQNRTANGCFYPATASNADVQTAYDHWKSLVLTTNGAGGEVRVQRTTSDGFDTVSEGIGYGLIVAVYMNDQATFDGLWRYEQKWLDSVGLMNWHINSAGTQVVGMGSATDADEDMAWALVQADKQWGGRGTLSDTYLNLAQSLIAKIWQYDVDHSRSEMLKPGDGWMEDKTNPSYFAPAYYRAFANVTGDSNWQKVIDTSYAILGQALTHGNADNGLVPDWCTSNGSTQDNYSYDACRTPFRIALDGCLNGEPRAKSYLAKISQFFSGIGANNIKDGYMLTGSPTGTSLNVAFLGPAAVAAMNQTSSDALLRDGYMGTAALTRIETYYYNASWGVLSLLMLTGNFLDYTQLP
jgi:endo-1,4-beta-D-glucanase Y